MLRCFLEMLRSCDKHEPRARNWMVVLLCYYAIVDYQSSARMSFILRGRSEIPSASTSEGAVSRKCLVKVVVARQIASLVQDPIGKPVGMIREW